MREDRTVDESVVECAARSFATAISEERVEDAERALAIAFGVAALLREGSDGETDNA